MKTLSTIVLTRGCRISHMIWGGGVELQSSENLLTWLLEPFWWFPQVQLRDQKGFRSITLDKKSLTIWWLHKLGKCENWSISPVTCSLTFPLPFSPLNFVQITPPRGSYSLILIAPKIKNIKTRLDGNWREWETQALNIQLFHHFSYRLPC